MTIDSILLALAYILIFPGFAFLAAYGLFLSCTKIKPSIFALLNYAKATYY